MRGAVAPTRKLLVEGSGMLALTGVAPLLVMMSSFLCKSLRLFRPVFALNDLKLLLFNALAEPYCANLSESDFF